MTAATRAPAIVIVVEDDPDVRDLLAALLELKGYSVLLAADGREALERLAAAEPLPGLILLDATMPGMSGIDFRAAQESDPRLAGLPIVVMSADPEIREIAARLRAVAFLKKPIATDALLELLRRFCPREDAAASGAR